MMEESTPRKSSKWRPHETYASRASKSEGGKLDIVDIERKGSAY
jgi:hypothetical protein